MTERPRHSERLMALDALEPKLRQCESAAWLTPGEQETLAELRDPDRRTQWLGCRWLAKELVREAAAEPTLAATAIHIQSSNGQGRADRPLAYVRGRLREWSLSIAHAERLVYVALTAEPGWVIGVDVTPAQPLRRSLVDAWFTLAERAWLDGADDPLLAAKVWAAKEAAYKALGRGEMFAPRQMEIEADQGSFAARWHAAGEARICRVEVRSEAGHVLALAFAPTDANSETNDAERTLELQTLTAGIE